LLSPSGPTASARKRWVRPASISRRVDAERLTGATFAVRGWASQGWLRAGLDVDRARDQLWTLNSPAVWVLLGERGWSGEDYETWHANALRALILR
jgi:hypothetical protein